MSKDVETASNDHNEGGPELGGRSRTTPSESTGLKDRSHDEYEAESEYLSIHREQRLLIRVQISSRRTRQSRPIAVDLLRGLGTRPKRRSSSMTIFQKGLILNGGKS